MAGPRCWAARTRIFQGAVAAGGAGGAAGTRMFQGVVSAGGAGGAVAADFVILRRGDSSNLDLAFRALYLYA